MFACIGKNVSFTLLFVGSELVSKEKIEADLNLFTFKHEITVYKSKLDKLVEEHYQAAVVKANAAFQAFLTTSKEKKLTLEELQSFDVSSAVQITLDKYTQEKTRVRLSEIDVLPPSDKVGVFHFEEDQLRELHNRLRTVDKSKVIENKASMEAKGLLTNKEFVVVKRRDRAAGQKQYYLLDGYHRVTALMELLAELKSRIAHFEPYNQIVENMFKEPDGSLGIILNNVRVLRWDTPLKDQVTIGEGLNEAEVSAKPGANWINRVQSLVRRVKPVSQDERFKMSRKGLIGELQRPAGVSARTFSQTLLIVRALVQYDCAGTFAKLMDDISMKYIRASEDHTNVRIWI